MGVAALSKRAVRIKASTESRPCTPKQGGLRSDTDPHRNTKRASNPMRTDPDLAVLPVSCPRPLVALIVLDQMQMITEPVSLQPSNRGFQFGHGHLCPALSVQCGLQHRIVGVVPDRGAPVDDVGVLVLDHL